MRLPVAMLVLAVGLACRTADPMLDAAIWTALGAGAAAANRAQGGCYALCTNGTYCDPKDGFCKPLPCLGRCDVNEICDERIQACLPRRPPPPLVLEGVRTSTRTP